MNAKDMQRYLTLVGRELDDMGVKGSIQLLMIGGGYMITQVKNRTFTGDIDTVWVYPEFHADLDVYWLFEAAVDAVAKREFLGSDWLNVTASDFVRAAGQGAMPKMRLWKKYGPVHVYLPPKEFILAHKFAAYREKDVADINVLCADLRVNTRKKAQKIIDKYISQDIQGNNHVADKLDDFFS